MRKLVIIIILSLFVKWYYESNVRFHQQAKYEADSLALVLSFDSCIRADSIAQKMLMIQEALRPHVAEGAEILVFDKTEKTWSNDSVFDFSKSRPFHMAYYRGKFARKKMKVFKISEKDVDVNNLTQLSLRDYYTIFQRQVNQFDAEHGKYYFYSIQDTTNYYSFTILYYTGKDKVDLILVNLNAVGITQSFANVAGYSYQPNNGFQYEQDHSTFVSYFVTPNKLIATETTYTNNDSFDAFRKPSEENYLAEKTIDGSSYIIGPTGMILQTGYDQKKELITHY